MRTIDLKHSALTFCFLLLLPFMYSTLAAQSPLSEAPIVWERYRVSGSDISVVFPKLPIRTQAENPCNEMTSNSFYAFAENAVYELSVITRNLSGNVTFCGQTRRFTDKTLDERLKVIRKEAPKANETIYSLGGRSVSKFVDRLWSRWVISDIKNHRWTELAITKRADATSQEEKFVNSIDLDRKEGKEIGNGSEVMLGDSGVDLSLDPSQAAANKVEGDPLIILAKPKAPYTDNARDRNVQGTVRLKVTFLANGGIGTVTAITGLPDGLTAQAISSAKRLVFLPKRVNNVPVSVARVVEYSFSIY